MPYSWHILKPNLTSAQDQLLPPSEVNWEALEFYPDDNPCFFVEPMQGTLQPDGIHEFVVTFAPHQVLLLAQSCCSRSYLPKSIEMEKNPLILSQATSSLPS